MSKDGILKSHSALIAGGSSGIGLETAKLLAGNDCQLHIAARDDDALSQICQSIIKDFGIEVEALPTDLSEPINAAALALDCENVDILINSFGSLPKGTIQTLQGEDWQTGFELRVFGAINLTREVYEGMLELGTGIIINIGGNVSEGDEDELCIVSANAALKVFCENLDKQAKREGVRVLSYFPQAGINDVDHAAALIRLIFRKLSS